jgi:type II secretory pathway predicted ATPase ExeA
VDELLREILLDFGVISRDDIRSGRAVSASRHDLTSTLHDFLLSLHPIGAHGVLIIDEAQHLPADVLEQIRVISTVETNTTRLLQVILIGQPSLLEALAHDEMRQLDSRVSVRATLKPLARERRRGLRLAPAVGGRQQRRRALRQRRDRRRDIALRRPAAAHQPVVRSAP